MCRSLDNHSGVHLNNLLSGQLSNALADGNPKSLNLNFLMISGCVWKNIIASQSQNQARGTFDSFVYLRLVTTWFLFRCPENSIWMTPFLPDSFHVSFNQSCGIPFSGFFSNTSYYFSSPSIANMIIMCRNSLHLKNDK